MNHSSCCQGRLGSSRPEAGKVRTGGVAHAVGFLLSGTGLIFMPKCPVCVAAYVMLFTGASISTTTAGVMRTSLIVGCFSTLVILALMGLNRMRRRMTGGRSTG
ncbi:MAG: hypothetical protein V4662_27730 [Verrucomicrobiota bacterium]